MYTIAIKKSESVISSDPPCKCPIEISTLKSFNSELRISAACELENI